MSKNEKSCLAYVIWQLALLSIFDDPVAIGFVVAGLIVGLFCFAITK